MMHFGLFAGGLKGLVGLPRHEGVAGHCSSGRTVVRRTDERKDNMDGTKGNDPKELSVTKIVLECITDNIEECEALRN